MSNDQSMFGVGRAPDQAIINRIHAAYQTHMRTIGVAEGVAEKLWHILVKLPSDTSFVVDTSFLRAFRWGEYDVPLDRLGLDSLDSVELRLAFDQVFQVDFEDVAHMTLDNIAIQVSARQPR